MFAIFTKRVANEENYLLFENKKSDVMQLKKKLNIILITLLNSLTLKSTSKTVCKSNLGDRNK